MYNVELSDFRLADLKVDDDNYKNIYIYTLITILYKKIEYQKELVIFAFLKMKYTYKL